MAGFAFVFIARFAMYGCAIVPNVVGPAAIIGRQRLLRWSVLNSPSERRCGGFDPRRRPVAVFAIPAVQACFGTETTVNR